MILPRAEISIDNSPISTGLVTWASTSGPLPSSTYYPAGSFPDAVSEGNGQVPIPILEVLFIVSVVFLAVFVVTWRFIILRRQGRPLSDFFKRSRAANPNSSTLPPPVTQRSTGLTIDAGGRRTDSDSDSVASSLPEYDDKDMPPKYQEPTNGVVPESAAPTTRSG